MTELRLNVGCGAKPMEGYTNVDVVEGEGVDIVSSCCDLPFDARSVDEVYSTHMAEHLTRSELAAFAAECYRILKPGGRIYLVAPDFETLLGVYFDQQNNESIEVEDFPISPLDWLDNALFARHLHRTDYHKQGIYKSKLLKVFQNFELHQVVKQGTEWSRWEIKLECRKPMELPCSVVMSTRNKAEKLNTVLKSIFKQEVPFRFEVIVVDDGSTDNTREVCSNYPVVYYHLDNPKYRNPSVARNVGYRAAMGRVIICQSDDIVHVSHNCIEYLTNELKDGEFLLSRTDNYRYLKGKPAKFISTYCSPQANFRRPYFFLGSILRSDLYAVGGCDEEFVMPCFDDNWLADCLIKGLRLKPRFTGAVIAHHQRHDYEEDSHVDEIVSHKLYETKCRKASQTGNYVSSGGPWTEEGVSIGEPKPEPEPEPDSIGEEPEENLELATIKTRGRDGGKIPPVMNFYWAGDNLSWMRFMTLCSFRFYHPSWKIVVHRSDSDGSKQWASSETQDSQTYHGPNYSKRIKRLNVEVREWKPPKENLAPVHASDLLQWEILSTEGGFYADMDVLFVKPLPYDHIKKHDAVFCLSEGFMAIGFFGASPNNPLFKQVNSTALEGYRGNRYQSTGAEAIYKTTDVWPNWAKYNFPGEQAAARLATSFPTLSLHTLPDFAVYPFNYKSTSSVFAESHNLPPECFALHWFGGNNLSQEWNSRLTEKNFREFPSTFTRYAALCYGG